MATIDRDGTGIVITGTLYNDDILSIGEKNTKNYIDGRAGNDYISSKGTYTTIHGGAGNDNIYTWRASFVEIYGDEDSDTILAMGKNCTLDGGTGMDSLLSGGDYSELYGGDGNDYILNRGNTVTIDGGDGTDTITNYGANVSINGGLGDDSIDNEGDNVTIVGGEDEGCDTVDNSGTNVSIVTGAGMDKIDNSGSDVTIEAGVGNDSIYNGGTNVSIDSGLGDDTIENEGSDVTIDAGAGIGNDFVENRGEKVSISTGEFNDTIKNYGASVTIDGGKGDDSIYNNALDISILGGDNNDTIENYGAGATIDGGLGDDSIYNALEGCETTITGGADKDTITSGGDSVSIDGGTEDDVIINTGNDVTISGGEGDGNDSIRNEEGNNVSIDGGDGDDTVNNGIFEVHKATVPKTYAHGVVVYEDIFTMDESVQGGDNVTITAGDGNDIIQNFGGSNVTIDAGDGKNQVSLGGSIKNISVNTGVGDDTIIAYSAAKGVHFDNNTYNLGGGSNVTINAGGGNNVIKIGSGWSTVEVNGGNHSSNIDVISNEAERAIIRGYGGLDIIENSGDNSFVVGGADGDMLSNFGNKVYIDGGDGIDHIYSDKGENVTIDGGNHADTIEVYHDVGASINGGAGNDNIFVGRVSADDYNEALKTFSTTIIDAVLSGFGVPLTTSDKLRDWLLKLTGAAFEDVSLKKLHLPGKLSEWLTGVSGLLTIWDNIGAFVNLNYNESTINGGTGDDTIVLDGFAPRVLQYSSGGGNDIVYYLATNRARKESKDALIAATHMSTLHVKDDTVDDVTVNGNNVILKIGTGSVNLVDAAKFRFKVREGNTLTTRIYGTNDGELISSNADDPENNLIIDGMGGNDQIYNYAHDSTISGGAGNDEINNQGAVSYKVRLNGDAGNDTIYGSSGHYLIENVTINGGVGNDKIELMNVDNALVEYSEGDGNDIVYRFDGNDTLKISALSYTTERTGFDVIVRVGNGSVTLKGSRFLRKLNIDGTPENELVEVTFYDMDIDGDKLSVLKLNPGEVLDVSDAPNEIRIIDASKANTSIKIIGNSSVDMVTGSKYADKIRLSPSANVVADFDVSEEDNSIVTVAAGSGDDSIYGDERPAVYIYNSGDGNDVISGFNATSTLSIGGAKYTSTTSGDDWIFSVGTGKITLQGAATLSTVNIIGDEEIVTLLTVTDSTKSPVTVAPYVKTVDASSRTKAVKIVGNDLANSIIGGTGNDTLTGGGGKDTFVYTAGKDVIADYAAGDKISLGAEITDTTVSGNNVVFTVGSGKLTVNGGKGKKLTLIDSAGKTSTTTINDVVTVTNSTKSPVTVAPYVKTVDASTRTKAVKITGNDLANSIIGGTGNDTLTGGGGKDTFVYTAGKDVIADYAAGDKISLGAEITATTVSGNNVIFTTTTGTLKINGGKGKKLTLIDSVGKTSTTTINDVVTVTDKTKSPVTVAPYVKTVDASSRTKAVKITGNDLANSIIGGTGNDTLTGGGGKDTFVYTTGKDVIADYAAGDKISLGAEITDTTVSGNNVIFTTTTGTLKINGGKGKKLTLIDSAGKTSTTTINDVVTVTNSTKSPVTVAPYVKTVDASSRTKAVKIVGNDLANSIIGGTGNDTLTGGTGNDSLWGNAGKDTFIYSSGKDIIYGFGKNDLLQITGAFSAPTYSSKNNSVAFKVGSGSITLKDFGTTTTFHVNDTMYQLSGGKLTKK